MKYGIPRMKLNRDILILLSSILILHTGIYMFTPIFPIILKSEKHFNAAQIGLILGIGSLAVQLGSAAGGILSDRFGKRYAMIAGAIMQSGAILGFGVAGTYGIILLFSVFNGIGGGIYAPTIRAAIAAIASSSAETRTTAFSLRGIAANVGISIGGLLTLILSHLNSIIVFSTASVIFLFLAVFTWFLLPKDCGGEECPKVPVSSYRLIFKNKPFMVYAAVSILISSIYSLFALLLPLRGEAVLSNSKSVGTIWTITSILVILFQSFISKYILQKLQPYSSLFFSMLFFGGGLFLIGLSYSFIFLVISAVVFLAGEMMLLPISDRLTSEYAQTELLGAYFSFSSIISGLGSALGSFFGGTLINTLGVKTNLLPWIIFGSSAVIVALIILFIKNLPILKIKTTD